MNDEIYRGNLISKCKINATDFIYLSYSSIYFFIIKEKAY